MPAFSLSRTKALFVSGLLALSAWAPLVAQAAPEPMFVPFEGAGNLVVFDAAAGSGGWVGSIDQVAPPVVPTPLSLVSVVLFNYNAMTRLLTGSFEFTTTDLASSLFGTLSGTSFDADILGSGGQFAIDYLITGGTGAFAGADGFGLSFLNYDPAGTFNNYIEMGLLNFTVSVPVPVPAPGTLALVLAGLLAAGTIRAHDARTLRTRRL